MPKIIRFHKIGGPENLRLEEAPPSQPGPGEVKLRVQAVGLNRAEALYMRGQYRQHPCLPSRIGYEVAGIVEALGPGVDAKWLGKQIATIPGYSMSQYGALGEEAIVPAESLAEYPDHLSPIRAAAIWMQYLTAYGALIGHGGIHPGDFVLVTAASSSVGVAAIQTVKAEGATAIATTRNSRKSEELLRLGADYVIATNEVNLAELVHEITSGAGARVIFDPIAGPFLEQLAAVAAPGGIIFEYGFLSMQPTPFPMRFALAKGLNIRGYSFLEVTSDTLRLQNAKDYIFENLQRGSYHPKIARTFSLAQAAEAYRYLESNVHVGKVVIAL